MVCKIPKGIDSILEVSYCIGSSIGCLVCVPICKKFGYVRSVAVFFIFSAIFSALTIIPVHWAYLMIIRCLTGIFASTCFSVVPLFVSEMLTPEEREKTMMGFSVSLNVGIFVTYLIHFGISFNYTFYPFIFVPPVV